MMYHLDVVQLPIMYILLVAALWWTWGIAQALFGGLATASSFTAALLLGQLWGIESFNGIVKWGTTFFVAFGALAVASSLFLLICETSQRFRKLVDTERQMRLGRINPAFQIDPTLKKGEPQ